MKWSRLLFDKAVDESEARTEIDRNHLLVEPVEPLKPFVPTKGM
jgi:hypothetical protein